MPLSFFANNSPYFQRACDFCVCTHKSDLVFTLPEQNERDAKLCAPQLMRARGFADWWLTRTTREIASGQENCVQRWKIGHWNSQRAVFFSAPQLVDCEGERVVVIINARTSLFLPSLPPVAHINTNPAWSSIWARPLFALASSSPGRCFNKLRK